MRDVVFIVNTQSDNDTTVARYIDSCACAISTVIEIKPGKRRSASSGSLFREQS
jgi:hypothetical protein